ncbi:MAG: DUF805 domain-containing protein [Rhizobiales bacterium]|nr:DUF805 domain-containing protein [Hyphomicrobiales bacterium]
MSNINWGNLLFSFGGRINRAKWWLTVLVSIIISVVAAIVTAVIPSEAFGTVVSLASFIPQFWISLAAGVKRLHDLNRSGAWLVLFYLGPALLISVFFAVVGVDVMAALLSDKSLDSAIIARVGTTAILVGALMFILAVWAFIWFGCLRGTVGPNQYGPDPLERQI